MVTQNFDIDFKSIEAEKDISNDKHKLMTTKIGDSVSIKNVKEVAEGINKKSMAE